MNDFGFYFKIGWEHIMSWDALDHILFVMVLAAIYLLKDWKKVLILVTAFTIGHSLTLALSILDVVRFPDKTVEILIPLTILITGVVNIFQKDFSRRALRINYFLALFFGLIHGMGFANTLRFMLASDQNIGLALFGFNVGLEIGQIVVVTIFLLLSYLIVNVLKLSRRIWVIVLSAVGIVFAVKMVVERI